MKKITAILLMALLLTACVDEFESSRNASYGDKAMIGFKAGSAQSWTASATTRAAGEAVRQPIPINGSDLSLGVHAVPGINEHFDMEDDHETVQSVKTRGVPYNSTDAANFYTKMGVTAYTYTGNWDGTQTPNFFHHVAYTKGDNGIYTSDMKYYWPDYSDNLRFYAYAPHNSTVNTATDTYLSPSANTVAGVPQLTYEVPADATKQPDLMVADEVFEGETKERESSWELKFRHILTAVQFMIGEGMPDGTITRVAIKNVVGRGTFYYHDVASDGTETTADRWVLESANKTFTQELAFTTTGVQNVLFVSGTNTFMMIPQELASDAVVEVDVEDDSHTTTTLSASIGGTGSKVWEQGETVTYVLSKKHDQYILEVSPGDLSISYGGINSYTGIYITSYVQKTDDTQEAVPWDAEYYDEDTDTWKSTNDLPDYAAFWRTSKDALYGYDGTPGFGGISAERRRWAMDAQEPTQGVSYHAEQLKARAIKGSAGDPVDLSTHPLNATTGLLEDAASARNTANCYVVPQPGYYKIPIVYGNAIKNGAANVQAYAPTGLTAGEYNMTMQHTWDGTRKAAVLTPFVNHRDEAITDPWIKNNSGCTVGDAVLIWQDEENLVTPTSVAVDGDFIKFAVPKETIHQGNAMIAVRNTEGTIMWSWHIWVTDENIMATHTIKNYEGDTYRLMKVNLGWCSNEGLVFAPRSLRIRIRQQPDAGKTAYFTVTQEGGAIPDDNTRGTCPYYQWGRKDPVLPSDGIVEFGTAPDKTIYSYNGYTPSCTTTIGDNDYWTIGESIQRPQYKYQKSYYALWQVTPVMNLWNANCNVLMVNSFLAEIPDEPIVTKTIYDPCPVGFSVPQLHTFTGLTSTGRSRTNRDNLTNVSRSNEWNGSTTGYYFYCDPSNKSDDNVWFFPCCGYREIGAGKAIRTGMYGGLWTATMTNLDNHIVYVSEGACAGIDVSGSGYFCIGYMSGYCSTSVGWSIRPIREMDIPISYGPTVDP